MHAHLLFLPVLSDPVPDAAGRIVKAIEKVVENAERLAQTDGFYTEDKAPVKAPSSQILGVDGF